jgi:hypothetical protein
MELQFTADYIATNDRSVVSSAISDIEKTRDCLTPTSLFFGYRAGLTPSLSGRLTVDHNVTLVLTLNG